MFEKLLRYVLGIFADELLDRAMMRIDDIVDAVMAHPHLSGILPAASINLTQVLAAVSGDKKNAGEWAWITDALRTIVGEPKP